jgi:hypothetical protein
MLSDDDYCDADELDFVAQTTFEETVRRMQPYINSLKARINQLEKQLEAHQQIQSAANIRECYYSTNLHQGQVQYLRDGTLEQSEDSSTEA